MAWLAATDQRPDHRDVAPPRDQAETPDPFMADRLTLEPSPGAVGDASGATSHRPVLIASGTALSRRPAQAPLPVEPRGTTPELAAQPAGHGVGSIQRARLATAGLPLSRRIRTRRNRLERLLGGSATLHVLLLVLLALLYRDEGRLQPPSDQPPVEMVFGQSGMVGNPASLDNGGGHPHAALTNPLPPAPQPQANPEVTPDMPPPPPPVPIPDLEPLPSPEVPPPPEPKPMTRIPLRMARPTPSRTQRSSPFSNPMDLSFSQGEPGPARSRTGRVSGSHAPIDLSLGPLVKNGRLNTPFATFGIKGVSDDYGSEIDAWIRRHLFYPPDAAQRGEDGPSHVHVVIDRGGHVKSVRLVDSSGSFALDDATEGMFRAARLPPVPPDMEGDHFDIDLTVNYILIRH